MALVVRPMLSKVTLCGDLFTGGVVNALLTRDIVAVGLNDVEARDLVEPNGFDQQTCCQQNVDIQTSDAKHVEFKKTFETLYSKVDMLSNVIMLPNTSTIM